MRRPCLASSSKRNGKWLLSNSPGKQTGGRLFRRLSPRLRVDMPVGRPEAALSAPRISAATETPNSVAAEVAACEPMRCGFGAVRVGALLGRVRLHLQTERFLAVHRGDILWERGCVGAALALAVIAAGMQEAELDAPLATAFSAASSTSRPREHKLKKQIPRALFEMAKANELSPERPRNDSFLASGSTGGVR
jgi:hypothetical protein